MTELSTKRGLKKDVVLPLMSLELKQNIHIFSDDLQYL